MVRLSPTKASHAASASLSTWGRSNAHCLCSLSGANVAIVVARPVAPRVWKSIGNSRSRGSRSPFNGKLRAEHQQLPVLHSLQSRLSLSQAASDVTLPPACASPEAPHLDRKHVVFGHLLREALLGSNGWKDSETGGRTQEGQILRRMEAPPNGVSLRVTPKAS